MKSYFRSFLLLLLLSHEMHGKEIILVTYDYKSDKMLMIKNIIEEKLLVPRKLITYLKTKSPCLKNKDTILHICIKENNEKIIFQNNEVLRKSFKSFSRK
ncbi:MAG: hypothetical protein HOJ35_07830 [Bdellovibrionales bacterium]|jgi:hypothetical protein|nr:hypothetical protein [Bdellovibrionales bacterium]